MKVVNGIRYLLLFWLGLSSFCAIRLGWGDDECDSNE